MYLFFVIHGNRMFVKLAFYCFYAIVTANYNNKNKKLVKYSEYFKIYNKVVDK